MKLYAIKKGYAIIAISINKESAIQIANNNKSYATKVLEFNSEEVNDYPCLFDTDKHGEDIELPIIYKTKE